MTDEPGWIVIGKWGELQHYKHRNPPWIRLYRKVLQNPEWRALSDFEVRVLLGLWILATEHGGKVPFDSMHLAYQIGLASTLAPRLHEAVNSLAARKFVRLKGNDASALASMDASDREQRAEIREQSSVPTVPPEAGRKTNGQQWAPILRACGVFEAKIGDVLANWLPHALKEGGPQDVQAMLEAEGARRSASGKLPWNPAAQWNAHNPDFSTRFRWALTQQRKRR